jgi:hypothetical protein
MKLLSFSTLKKPFGDLASAEKLNTKKHNTIRKTRMFYQMKFEMSPEPFLQTVLEIHI